MSKIEMTALTVGGPWPGKRVKVDGNRHSVPKHGGVYVFVDDEYGGPVYMWRKINGRKPPEIKKKAVTIRIPETLLAEVEIVSRQTYKPKSAIICEALTAYLKEKTK